MRGCTHPAESLEFLFEARDYVTGDRFEIRRCSTCGLALTVPPPSSDVMAKYYPAGYYGQGTERRFPAAIEALQGLLYSHRAQSVEAFAGKPGRVLDIGCGPGWLLRAFQRRGWQVCGTELSEAASRHAREILKLPVQVGSLGALPWPNDCFDAVVLWHVLEHVVEPAAVLQEAARVLNRGGVLLVGVPNFGSLEAQLGRGKWFHLDVPRHLAHFTQGVLEQALVDAGFAVRQTSFFAPEYDPFSFVQTALNRLGLPHNLLYNMLRGRGAKVLENKESDRMSAALSWLLAAPLGLASLPWTLVLGCLSQGATVTMWAVKNPKR